MRSPKIKVINPIYYKRFWGRKKNYWGPHVRSQPSNFPFDLDCSIDDQNMDTNSSIHSYDGSTANPSLEELAHCELGETEQVRD